MKAQTLKQAKQNAKQFEHEAVQDAYLRGFDRGYNCASWQDLPEIGAKLFTDSDGRITVTEDNQWDVVQSLASEAESNSRDFSPFEFTASEFNSADDSEEEDDPTSDELWEAFDSGISDGILANITERKEAA